jgi:hypothetical protein
MVETPIESQDGRQCLIYDFATDYLGGWLWRLPRIARPKVFSATPNFFVAHSAVFLGSRR